ncbi:hypothetical protein F5148DRAFT_1205894 [Russula earlei]|uniref:Uncharacterized protein n=1 Tax=Russula earlei TaxID=71964 RepID=A0ACC0U6S7_9AGAM|nr:hypothetical protein F5148DRAFT_1205894 [Russula earlei]
MTTVELFLVFPDTQPSSVLLIPHSDIERLAIFPFRWMRYVMYTICGARGKLTTPNGSEVDYDETNIPGGETKYHYTPSDALAFIDDRGLSSDQSSNSVPGLSLQSSSRTAFRHDVIRQDGPVCVISGTRMQSCDAAHLIPRSKGDEYIANEAPSSIDDVRNGIFVSKNIHAELGLGAVAFIKTPNYGLGPDHIKRFERGSRLPREERITLHCLRRPDNYDPRRLEAYLQMGPVRPGTALGLANDADCRCPSLPSTVILNYFYGIAAYKTWHSGVSTEIDKHRQKYHAQQLTPALTQGITGNYSEVEDPGDDDEGSEYLSSSQERPQQHRTSRWDEMPIGEDLGSRIMEWRDHVDV